MSLKYTNSKDGTPRANLRVTIRLDAEEIDEIKRLARLKKYPWRTWLRNVCTDGLYSAIVRHQDEEKRP